jgi:hypothetical protein
VMNRPIVKQRLDKHIRAQAYARKNSTSITRQRINKQAFSTVDRLFSAFSVPRGYKGTKNVGLSSRVVGSEESSF